MVAEVIINSTVKNLNKTFDYNVPAEIAGTISVGSRVLVPFGNSRKLEEGFVVGFKEKSNYKVKDIYALQDGFRLTRKNIELAQWMANKYFCNISDCIKMMLPPGTTSKIVDNRVKEKSLNFVYLKKDEDEIMQDIEQKKLKSDKQIRAINFLRQNDGILVTDLEVFADVSRAIINTLEKNGYIEIIEKNVQRNPFINKDVKASIDLELTNEQQIAYNSILDTINKEEFKEFLIYGITGSRKNRNIFAINKENFRKKQICYNASSRNIFNSTNGR